jgi:hypothetical protein
MLEADELRDHLGKRRNDPWLDILHGRPMKTEADLF